MQLITTNYWTTYTAGDDMTREVLAVLVVHQLSDDHTTGRAEIPAFGIVIENDAAALIRALDTVAREVARRYAHLNLRFGAMTVAMGDESRPLLWPTNDDEQQVTPERYESMRDNPRKGPHDLALLSELFGEEVVVRNEEGFVETDARLEEVGERFDRKNEIGPAGEMHFDQDALFRDLDLENLNPVATSEHSTIENVALLKAIDRRYVDDHLALHDAETASRLDLRDTPRDRLAPHQSRLLFVDDVTREDAQRTARFWPDGEVPDVEIKVRIDDNHLAKIVGHPGRRVAFVDDRCLAEEVGAGLALFEDGHLAGVGVDRSNDDSAFVACRSPTRIGHDQQLSSSCRSGKPLNVNVLHSFSS